MPTTLFLWYLPYVEYILEKGKFMDERREVSEEEYVKGVTNKHRVFFEGKRAIDCLFYIRGIIGRYHKPVGWEVVLCV